MPKASSSRPTAGAPANCIIAHPSSITDAELELDLVCEHIMTTIYAGKAYCTACGHCIGKVTAQLMP